MPVAALVFRGRGLDDAPPETITRSNSARIKRTAQRRDTDRPSFRKQLMEFVEIRRTDIGNSEHLHPALAPIDPVVAKLRTGLRGHVRIHRRPNEDIDDVLAPPIHQHCDLTAFYNIEASALQRKAIACEIAHWWGEIHFAVEPRLYRVLVCRHNIYEMAGLQRAQV